MGYMGTTMTNMQDMLWEKMGRGVFVVAELGKNFIQTEEERPVAEYLKNAKELVREAKAAGADAVKFQTHNVEDEQLATHVVAPHFSWDRHYWVTRNTKATPLDAFWIPLKRFCDAEGITFFSTPMSRGAAEILSTVGVDLWKAGSCDLTDFVMLDYMRRSGKPIIISAGMSTLEEVDAAVRFLKEKNDRVALLHCVSKYPCPPEDLHLNTIGFFKERYRIPVGFSDHSIGIDSAFGAVALGATIIEKHFSRARDLWGADHKVSMIPEEFAALTGGIRVLADKPEQRAAYLAHPTVKAGMGKAAKIMDPGEEKFRSVFRKCLMAGREIPAGTVITAEHLYAMRPFVHAGGIPSERYEEILGKKAARTLKKFDPITVSILT